MKNDTSLEGRIALITGAASGIGRSLALAMARRGMSLALVDIDEPGLTETVERIGAAKGRVTIHRLDLTDRAAITALPAAIRADHGGLDVLVNNAGVAVSGTFDSIAEADFDWLFAVNFFAAVQMTRHLLPMLRESDDGRIVNVSSLFGLIALPGQSAYAASKFALRGFSESLRHELAGSRIGVTVVYPGGVATSIVANARAPRTVPTEDIMREKRAFTAFLTMSPDHAAESIVRGIERRRARLIVGGRAQVAAFVERVFPLRHVALLSRLGGRTRRSFP